MLNNNQIVLSSSDKKSAVGMSNKSLLNKDDYFFLYMAFGSITGILLLSVSYLLYCYETDQMQDLVKYADQFNRYFARNHHHLYSMPPSAFLILVAFNILKQCVFGPPSKATKVKNTAQNSSAQIVKTLKMETPLKKIRENPDVRKDKKESTDILKPLSFLQIIHDYENKEVAIVFERSETKFFVPPEMFGFKSQHNVLIEAGEFLVELEMGVLDDKIGVEYTLNTGSFRCRYIDNKQLHGFVNLVLKVIKVIVEYETLFLDYKDILKNFNTEEANMIVKNLKIELVGYKDQKLYDDFLSMKENKKLVVNYIDRIKNIDKIMEEIGLKQKELRQKLNNLSLQEVQNSSNEQTILSYGDFVYRYQQSIRQVEEKMAGLKGQYQRLENGQRGIHKYGANYTTVAELLTLEQESSMQMNQN